MTTRRSYWGKLAAPARTARSDVNRVIVRRADIDDDQIDADATTIPVQNNADWDSAGIGYMGAETFSYTGLGTPNSTGFSDNQPIGTFTGVTKGIYPALQEDNRGHTYPYPREIADLEGDVGSMMVCASEPFTLIGREIGLYAAVREPATGEWSEGSLVWAGQIVQDVEWDPDTNTWVLAAESILRLLDRPIARHLPKASCELINLNGDLGRIFHVAEYLRDSATDTEELTASAQVEITAGYYMPSELQKEILNGINTAANWTDIDGAHSVGNYKLRFTEADDGSLAFTVDGLQAAVDEGSRWVIQPYDLAAAGNKPCHAWQALGFDVSNMVILWLGDVSSTALDRYRGGTWQASRLPYHSYHPIDPNYNGGKMRIRQHQNDPLWADQGDWGSTMAWVKATPEDPLNAAVEGGIYVTGYSALTDYGVYQELTLHVPNWLREQSGGLDLVQGAAGFCGSSDSMHDLEVSQVYYPGQSVTWSPPRGPLEALLYPLLSTGTAAYNHATYDACPEPLSVDFPAALIDTASVCAVDRTIMAEYADLCLRPWYIIDEATPWSEIWGREAQLFGVVLAWDDSQGKLVCRSVINPAFHLAEVTINDAARIGWAAFPKVRQTVAHVVNQWRVTAHHPYAKGKQQFEGLYRDEESYQGIRAVSEVIIDHPGLRVPGGSTAVLGQHLTELFLARTSLFRALHQEVRVALAPKMRGLVSVGDIVYYTAGRAHPDPVGSGLMEVTTLPALVLDVAWSPARESGSARLLIFASEHVPAPWGVAALVDQTATNGGWDSVNLWLTTVALTYGATGDPDDAAPWKDGDFVKIIETAAEVPTAAAFAEYGPFEVASDYETDGAGLLTLVAGTAMAGWDSDKEYRIVSADYDSCPSTQQAVNLYQAGTDNHMLGAADDEPDYWG